MSNSGDDDQPLAPRRSLRKTPASVDVDAATQPVVAPGYKAAPQPRQNAGAPMTPSRPDSAARPPVPAYAGQPTPRQQQERTQPQPAPAAAQTPPRRVRRARLRCLRVDPWSITKIAFLLSVALGIMCVVAVFLVVSIITASGLWDNVNESIQGVLNQDPADAFDITDYVGLKRILGLTMLIAVLDVVLMTALATLGAFLYNLAASLLGGVEVTLAEDTK